MTGTAIIYTGLLFILIILILYAITPASRNPISTIFTAMLSTILAFVLALETLTGKYNLIY